MNTLLSKLLTNENPLNINNSLKLIEKTDLYKIIINNAKCIFLLLILYRVIYKKKKQI